MEEIRETKTQVDLCETQAGEVYFIVSTFDNEDDEEPTDRIYLTKDEADWVSKTFEKLLNTYNKEKA